MLYALGADRPQLIGGGHYLAPTAAVIGRVRLHACVSIWFGAVLRGDTEWIEVGEGSNIQDLSLIHTDPGVPMTIGRDVTIGHRVVLHGCLVDDGALIGNGAIVLDRAKIGRGALVAAGSVVSPGTEIAPYMLVMGAPARAIRELRADEQARMAQGAAHYRTNGRRYNIELQLLASSTADLTSLPP